MFYRSEIVAEIASEARWLAQELSEEQRKGKCPVSLMSKAQQISAALDALTLVDEAQPQGSASLDDVARLKWSVDRLAKRGAQETRVPVTLLAGVLDLLEKYIGRINPIPPST